MEYTVTYYHDPMQYYKEIVFSMAGKYISITFFVSIKAVTSTWLKLHANASLNEVIVVFSLIATVGILLSLRIYVINMHVNLGAAL